MANLRSFVRSGHTPTLVAAFLYFDLAFMVWVILGPLGVQISKDLQLTHAERGLMVATPVLAGALLRIPPWADFQRRRSSKNSSTSGALPTCKTRCLNPG